MGTPNKKKILIEKICKEQPTLDPKDLWRLPIEELRKMDAIVPDSDGGDLLGAPTAPVEPVKKDDVIDPSAPVVAQTPVVDAVRQPKVKKGAKLIGYHPVTDAEVYE
jgi:hypothetical protein